MTTEFNLDVLPSPDDTGSSEYRAIYEVLEDAAEDADHALAILDTFREAAESSARALRGARAAEARTYTVIGLAENDVVVDHVLAGNGDEAAVTVANAMDLDEVLAVFEGDLHETAWAGRWPFDGVEDAR